MPKDLPLSFNKPLCATGIVMGKDVLFLDSQGLSRARVEEAVERPRPEAPGMMTLVPLKSGMVDSERLRLYLDRYPAESLDRSVFVAPPELVGDRSLAQLGEWADRLGMPVRFPVRALDTTVAGDLPLAQHRVLDLDAAGTQVTPGTGEWVQVLPAATRAAVAEALLNGSQRLVLTSEGAQLGMPPDQVRRLLNDALSGHRTITAPLRKDVIAAVGTTPSEADGYVHLSYVLRDLAPGGQVLVVAADRPFLVTRHKDSENLAVIDVAAAEPGLLPLQPGTILYADLPAGFDLAGLRETLYGVQAQEPELFQWRTAGGDTYAIEVIGPDTGVRQHLPVLAQLAQDLAQPMIVAGVQRPGAAVTGQVRATLDERLEVFGWSGEVPLVVTLGDVATLEETLTTRNAAVLYQAPGLSTGGSLVNLGPPPWAIREPGTKQPATVREDLSADLIGDSGVVRRRPPFERPTMAVGNFLTTRLSEPETLRGTIRQMGADPRLQLGQVEEISARVPAFAGHRAVLHLANAGKLDATIDLLSERTKPGAIFGPLLTGAPPQVPALLPQLAALADQGLDDVVSYRLTMALSDLIGGTRPREKVVADINELGPQLPKAGGVRGEWVVELAKLRPLLSEHPGVLDDVMQAVVRCPD